MAIYVKINETQYPASITGRIHDSEWDDRSSKAITLEMTYEDAKRIFVDDIKWSIEQEVEHMEDKHETVIIDEETGETEDKVTQVPVTKLEEYDNSEYSIAGDIIDHRNGKITVKMGKPTDKELLITLEQENAELLFSSLTGEDFNDYV